MRILFSVRYKISQDKNFGFFSEILIKTRNIAEHQQKKPCMLVI